MDRARVICVIAFMVAGSIARAEDLDVKALQARLDAQEARMAEQAAELNDLKAKMRSSSDKAYAFAADMGTCGPDAPESILSLQKNATVKVGGEIGTRYYYHDAERKTSLYRYDSTGTEVKNTGQWDLNDRQTVGKWKNGDFKTSDAFVSFTIDVNDNFDAFMRLDVLDSTLGGWDTIARYAWVRWKNICNSGFGVLVGKSDLVFGESSWNMAVITPWTGGEDGENAGKTEYTGSDDDFLTYGLGPYIGYDHNRQLQLTPYWKSQDGRYSVEASFFQGIEWYNGGGYYTQLKGGPGSYYYEDKSLNAGWGSASLRVRAEPIEGLNLSASVINVHTNESYLGTDGTATWVNMADYGGPNNKWYPGGVYPSYFDNTTKKNNSAVALGVKWVPSFLPKGGIWSQYMHNWNAGWLDRSTDVVTTCIWYGFTDRLTAFVQGDYFYGKSNYAFGDPYGYYKTNAWASYVGLKYILPYGVSTELGWRHDDISYKNSFGDKHTTLVGDTIYGSLYFDF